MRIQCERELTTDSILLSCCERGRTRILKVEIRGLMRTQKFEIRKSLLVARDALQHD